MKSTSSGPEAGYREPVRRGVLIGLAVLALVLPPAAWLQRDQAAPGDRSARPTPGAPRVLRLASFGDEALSADARHVAHWAVDSGDPRNKAFVIVDKKDAKVYVFNPRGELVASAPALLGAAHGDHTVPGIGDKPLSEVLPEEKTTPAGRFIAEPGVNLKGEDIVWVDYDAAVSLHRVRPLVKAERRLERLASPTPEDNRISFGCINLPVEFYENVLSPTVRSTGAVVYVLPETRTPREVFGSYDVLPAAQVAHR